MVLSWYQNVSGRETWVGHLRWDRAWGGGTRAGQAPPLQNTIGVLFCMIEVATTGE
jgi:hypothetical protein